MSAIQRYEYALDIVRQLTHSNGNRIKCTFYTINTGKELHKNGHLNLNAYHNFRYDTIVYDLLFSQKTKNKQTKKTKQYIQHCTP